MDGYLYFDCTHVPSKVSHTNHSRFIPEGVAEASIFLYSIEIFLHDAYVLPKLLSYEEYCSRNRW
jgi:hypothetical protein